MNKTTLFIFLFAIQAFAIEDHGYTTLKLNSLIKIDAKGVKLTKTETKFKITSEIGRTNLSNYKVAFFGKPANFKLISAASEFAGSRHEVTQSTLKVTDVQNEAAGLIDAKLVIIPMTNLQLGSVVSIAYEVKEEPLFPMMAETAVQLSTEQLADEEIYKIESALPIKFLKQDFENFFALKEWNDKGVFHVEVKPTTFAYTTVGKLVQNAVFFASTLPAWDKLERNVSPGYRAVWAERLPPELEKIAGISYQAKTLKERIEVASREISKIVTYSGTWTSPKAKFFPQRLADVMKSKKGDCKDFSSMLVAVLRRQGIEAYPALTFRSPVYLGKEKLTAMARLPQLSMFNHAIVWVKDGAQEVWVDPTNPLVLADAISSDILGNFALLLDGKASDVKFLPDANAKKSDLTVEQVLKISPDNSVMATGTVKANEVSYNLIGQIERQHGTPAVALLINKMINLSEKMNIQVSKVPKGIISDYGFSYISSKMITEEKSKGKHLLLIHPVLLSLAMTQLKKDSYFGDIGEYKYVTTIKNAKTPDTFEQDCFAPTKWIESQRVIENTNGDIVITDTVRTKLRMADKTETSEEEFKSALDALSQCARANFVTLQAAEVPLAAQDKHERAQLGSDIYKMTDREAEKLNDVRGALGITAKAKMFKYYSLKLKKNPNDATAMGHVANGAMFMGYESGEKYRKGHLDYALNLVNKAAELDKKQVNPTVLRTKIYVNMRLGFGQLALNDLATYIQVEKDKFKQAQVAADISYLGNSFDYVPAWIKRAETLAKTPEQKMQVYHLEWKLAMALKDLRGQIMALEKMIEAHPEDPWNYHNLACTYMDNSQSYDRVIELEKRALSISNFGAARSVLSNAYYSKAKNLQQQQQDGNFANEIASRLPASSIIIVNGVKAEKLSDGTLESASVNTNPEEFLKLLQEAIKYNDGNVYALGEIAQYYMQQLQKDPMNLMLAGQARHYVDMLLKADPERKSTKMMAEDLKKYETR